MEPFMTMLAVVLLVGAATASLMWRKILTWSENHLFPWVSEHLPELEPEVRRAFAVLDKAVVALRNATREAWRELRRNLLKQVAEFIRQFDGSWVVEVTSWIASRPDTSRTEVTKVVTQQQVSYEDLPDDVRRQYLRNNQISHLVNVTELRDAELSLVDG
jgi:hypothetical protein